MNKEFNIRLSNYIDSNVNSRLYVRHLLNLEDIKDALDNEKKIIIDFDDISFISRSAFHELISFVNKSDNKFVFVNMKKSVEELFNVIHNSIKTPIKKFPKTFIRKEVKTIEDLESSLSCI